MTDKTSTLTLPIALINALEHVPGFNRAEFEAVHQSGAQVTSIRFNPAKRHHFSDVLPLADLLQEPVPWSSKGYYLTTRPSFTTDPLFHAGAYYVQEASSMFLEEALRQTTDLSQPLKVLDCCAAPGGKSTLLQSVLSGDSLLISNEIIKSRVTILAENISKWGADNVIVTNNDPKDFQRLPGYFDVIVVDAPCSGSGLFRKDPAAIDEWSESNVELCSQRQERILNDVLPALKNGGVLIYSTCSYSEEEDEQIADWLIEQQSMTSIPLQLQSDWQIVQTFSKTHRASGYRFYPDKIMGEGFFIAAFRKSGYDDALSQKKQRISSEKPSAKDVDALKPYLQNTANYFFIKQQEDIIAMPSHLQEDLGIVQSNLYIKKAGVKMGTLIRQELIPDHILAISTLINTSLPSVEVGKEDALQFLRRQDIRIDTTVKGWALLTHQRLPLGWIKVLPNRINNYYPKEWRILNK